MISLPLNIARLYRAVRGAAVLAGAAAAAVSACADNPTAPPAPVTTDAGKPEPIDYGDAHIPERIDLDAGMGGPAAPGLPNCGGATAQCYELRAAICETAWACLTPKERANPSTAAILGTGLTECQNLAAADCLALWPTEAAGDLAIRPAEGAVCLETAKALDCAHVRAFLALETPGKTTRAWLASCARAYECARPGAVLPSCQLGANPKIIDWEPCGLPLAELPSDTAYRQYCEIMARQYCGRVFGCFFDDIAKPQVRAQVGLSQEQCEIRFRAGCLAHEPAIAAERAVFSGASAASCADLREVEEDCGLLSYNLGLVTGPAADAAYAKVAQAVRAACGGVVTCFDIKRENAPVCAMMPAEATAGAPCASNADCGALQCVSGAAASAGYGRGVCTFACGAQECVLGHHCVPVAPATPGIPGACLRNCATAADCGEGFACAGIPGACVPACATDADCAQGRVCDTASGVCLPPVP